MMEQVVVVGESDQGNEAFKRVELAGRPRGKLILFHRGYIGPAHIPLLSPGFSYPSVPLL